MAVLLHLFALLPLHAPGEPVHPPHSSGFAGTILVAFIVVGLLSLVMVFITSKPKNRRRQ